MGAAQTTLVSLWLQIGATVDTTNRCLYDIVGGELNECIGRNGLHCVSKTTGDARF
jgi:hypothetical protein